MTVVAQHQNQFYGRSTAHDPARFGSFGSPPSDGFREVNCRSFESRAGLFQTQSKSCKRTFSGSVSPKTRSPLTSLPVNTVKRLTLKIKGNPENHPETT